MNKRSNSQNWLPSREGENTIQDAVFEAWQKEISENPHFSEADFKTLDQFLPNTQALIGTLLDTISQESMPVLPENALEPLVKGFHSVLKTQRSKGFTLKDTTLLIFSLKSTLAKLIKSTSERERSLLTQFENLLDLFGLIAFELYSAEKDRLLSLQSEQIHYLQNQQKPHFDQLIGKSPKMEALFNAMNLVLDNDISVLLLGESGTGKELVAKAIHANSKRKNNPLITLNCAAIPKELIESELFGHEKGAFTGAETKKLGKFELANTGTLFLDEIGELPLDMQAKLLRVLQNQEVDRVGSTETQNVDVRIIAATNQDLKKWVDEKKFRLDLYYRLNVFPLHIPALRERKEDIVPLAYHFIKKYDTKFKLREHHLSEDAQNWLLAQQFEGNVRELENLIQRAVILAPTDMIDAQILQLKPGELVPENAPKPLSSGLINRTVIEPLDVLERKAILQALELTQGNLKKAAEALQVSRTTFYNKLKKYGLSPK